MRRLVLLIAIGIFCVISANAKADQGSIYHLSFPHLHLLPGERVSKLDLHIRSAMIIGFRTIPVGWQINIDNDPSWMTQVSGIAIVGAAWLEPSALKPWFLSLLAGPGGRSERTTRINVAGYIAVSNGDNTRFIEIMNRDVPLIRPPR
jgi:hypothetical protein